MELMYEILKAIYFMIMGFCIGGMVVYRQNKKLQNSYKESIEAYEELVGVMEERIEKGEASRQSYKKNYEELAVEYKKAFLGVEDLVNQNIELRKKLKTYEG